MRRHQIVTLCVVLAVTVAVLGAKAWTKSGGQAAATPTVSPLPANGQPVLLFFNGEHGRCNCEREEFQAAERSFAGVPHELLSNFAVHRINIERPTDLVRQYRVLSPPTVILLDAQGREVYRREYGVHRETLIEQMTAVLAEGPGGGS